MVRNLIVFAAVAVSLAACATTEQTKTTYDDLRAQCDQQGGILVPAPGGNTGNDRTDYVCDIKQGSHVSR